MPSLSPGLLCPCSLRNSLRVRVGKSIDGCLEVIGVDATLGLNGVASVPEPFLALVLKSCTPSSTSSSLNSRMGEDGYENTAALAYHS